MVLLTHLKIILIILFFNIIFDLVEMDTQCSDRNVTDKIEKKDQEDHDSLNLNNLGNHQSNSLIIEGSLNNLQYQLKSDAQNQSEI